MSADYHLSAIEGGRPHKAAGAAVLDGLSVCLLGYLEYIALPSKLRSYAQRPDVLQPKERLLSDDLALFMARDDWSCLQFR